MIMGEKSKNNNNNTEMVDDKDFDTDAENKALEEMFLTQKNLVPAEIDESDETTLLQTELMEINENQSRQNAKYCWDGVIDSVLQVRHTRNWRMMVRRAFKSLAGLVVTYGFLSLFKSIFEQKVSSRCDEGLLSNSFTKVQGSCMDEEFMKVCKVQCLQGKNAGKFGFHICHQSVSNDKAWVPLISCND